MSVSAKDIRHIAALSKLNLTDKEVEQYRREISGIVRYVEHLAEVNVSRLDPTTRLGLSDNLRNDIVEPWDEIERDAALNEAPRKFKKQIIVPRIFES